MTSAQETAEATIAIQPEAISLGTHVDQQLERLRALRAELVLERERAVSPAVARALEMSDISLFLALGYLGYTEELFPGDPTAATGHV
jgi:hypothetical protein